MSIRGGMGVLVLVGLVTYGIDVITTPSSANPQTLAVQPSAMLAQTQTAQSGASPKGIDEQCKAGETLNIDVTAEGIKPTRTKNLRPNTCEVILKAPGEETVEVKYCCPVTPAGGPVGAGGCQCMGDQKTNCDSLYPIQFTSVNPKSQVAAVAGVVALKSVNCNELAARKAKYSSTVASGNMPPPAVTPPPATTPPPVQSTTPANTQPGSFPSYPAAPPATAQPPANSAIIAAGQQGPAAPAITAPQTAPVYNGQPVTVAPIGQPSAGNYQPGSGYTPSTGGYPSGYTPSTFTGPNNFGYTAPPGGGLVSPITSFTSGMGPSALFNNVSSFIGRFINPSYAPTFQGSTGPTAGSTPTTASGPTFSTPLILVVPPAGGKTAADITALENLQKILGLGRPTLAGGTPAPISLSGGAAPVDASSSAISGANYIIGSTYAIGTAIPINGGSVAQDTQAAPQEAVPSDTAGFSNALNLSWATPTAVIIGIPVSLTDAPANPFFGQFNGEWVASSGAQTPQTSLAQAQINYDSTQAQLAAWQQLQAVGLCDSTCLTSMAALESQVWQQQAQVTALTNASGNENPAPQQAPAPVMFPSAGQSTPSGSAPAPAPENVSNQNNTAPAPAGSPALNALMGTSPAPSAIAQYASQPDTNSPSSLSNAPQQDPAPAATTSSNGLVGLPAALAGMWQTLTNWLAPSGSSAAPAAPAHPCSLLGSMFGWCSGS